MRLLDGRRELLDLRAGLAVDTGVPLDVLLSVWVLSVCSHCKPKRVLESDWGTKSLLDELTISFIMQCYDQLLLDCSLLYTVAIRDI